MFFDVDLPRVPLIQGPTALDEAPRLSRELGVSRLLIKRDDCTGVGLGGNKLRKLEFILADAMNVQADTVITTGGIQSNHTRLTAAAAKKYGLDACLLLRTDEDVADPETVAPEGNILPSRMLGADIRFKKIPSPELATAEMERIADELRGRGRRPYIIPSGGASPLGVVGYVYGGLELAQQLLARDLPQPEAVVVACGSCGTLAGLLVAKRFLSSPHRLIGICVGGRNKTEAKERTIGLARDCAKLLQMDIEIDSDDLETYDDYIGEGYARPGRRDLDAIRMLLACEGVFLDPVYTGRAMGGLIDLIRTKKVAGKKPIVFFHTGGTPALFAYGHLLADASFQGTPR